MDNDTYVLPGEYVTTVSTKGDGNIFLLDSEASITVDKKGISIDGEYAILDKKQCDSWYRAHHNNVDVQTL